jgi:hypothetical protein
MHMDSKKLEELLKKYWDCETSLEEEAQLREYFRSDSIPEHLKETAVLFRYFEEQKAQSLDPRFDKGLVAGLKKTAPVGGGRLVRLVYNSMKIAAGIAVLLMATYFVRQEIRKDDPVAIEDTYDDPQRAFEETKKALLMISKGFGTAEQQAKRINMFNEAQEKVQSPAKDEAEL